MQAIFRQIYRSLRDSLRDVLPIVIVVVFFELVVLRQPVPELARILGGSVMVVLGLALFVRGLELGLFPLGEGMANSFVQKGSLAWLLGFAFLLGFGTTVAEPALIAIAYTDPTPSGPKTKKSTAGHDGSPRGPGCR